jgi:high affinity Mn2+ porin
VQVAGVHWRRKADSIGVALGTSGISRIHQQYLSAGGLGFNLGDGGLRYGSESTLEGYYLYQASNNLQATADFQYVVNPGYNRDRGPAPIISLRLRFNF